MHYGKIIHYVSIMFPFLFNALWKHNAFHIQLLYKARYFVNNVMCSWKLFLAP